MSPARSSGFALVVLTGCAAVPISFMSLEKPPEFQVVGPSVTGFHCGGWWLGLESYRWGMELHDGHPGTGADFGRAVKDALSNVGRPADGMVDAEFWQRRSWAHWGRYCAFVRGTPVILGRTGD